MGCRFVSANSFVHGIRPCTSVRLSWWRAAHAHAHHVHGVDEKHCGDKLQMDDRSPRRHGKGRATASKHDGFAIVKRLMSCGGGRPLNHWEAPSNQARAAVRPIAASNSALNHCDSISPSSRYTHRSERAVQRQGHNATLDTSTETSRMRRPPGANCSMTMQLNRSLHSTQCAKVRRSAKSEFGYVAQPVRARHS